MDPNNKLTLGFEFLDIEIIDHKKKSEIGEKWDCDQCSLFYLSEEKLLEHKKKHERCSSSEDTQTCQYCNKILYRNQENKEAYTNRKCQTCEYKCSHCPQRFMRLSSLVHHEKSHSVKKGKSVPANKTLMKNSAKHNYSKKRKLETTNPENGVVPVKKKRANKSDCKVITTPKVKQKTQLEENFVNNGNESIPIDIKIKKKSLAVSPVKTEGKKGSPRKKQNEQLKSSVLTPASSSTSENTAVNYKPFSCHVCGDTFASDSALIDHIKSHGKEAKHFKCKYCGDEFEDVYKMQFHLAICPLAEDGLESSFMLSVPSKIKALGSNDSSPMKKRERSKRSRIDMKNEEESFETTKHIKKEKISSFEVITEHKRSGRRKTLGSSIKPPSVNDLLNIDCNDLNGRLIKNEDNPLVNTNPDFPEMISGSVASNKKVGRRKSLSSSMKLWEVNDSLNIDNDDFGESFDHTFDRRDKSETQDMIPGKRKDNVCPFPSCGMKFTREKALLCHMRNHSDDFDESLKCHKCDIPFDDLQSLRIHINICKGIKEEKDDDFNGSLNHRDAIESTNNPIQNLYRRGEFVCNKCGRHYLTQEKLKSHKCQGGYAISKKFPCRLCGEALTNQETLKEHFKTNHPNNLHFQCPSCSLEFEDLTEVNEHFLKHFKHSFKCSICFKKMTSKGDLTKHYSTTHKGEDRTLCSICYKRFNDTSALVKHKLVHTGERPFPCPFCFVSFSLKSSQVVHVRRHINFRPFKCNVCPKSFYNSGDLRKHNRIHSGERPYSCSVCDATFYLKESFNTHFKRHQKDLRCVECLMTFSSKKLLTIHLLAHHGNSSPGQGGLRNGVTNTSFRVTSKKRGRPKKEKAKSSLMGTNTTVVGHPKKVRIQNNFTLKTIRSQRQRYMRKSVNTNTVDYCEQERRMQRNINTGISEVEKNKCKRQKNRRNSEVFDCSKIKIEDEVCNSQYDKEIADPKRLQTDNGSKGFQFVDVKIEVPHGGVLEVSGFEPASKMKINCSTCATTFSSYEDLLKHVYIHI